MERKKTGFEHVSSGMDAFKKAIEKTKQQHEKLKEFFKEFAPGRSIRDIAASLEIDFSYLAKVLRGEAFLADTQKVMIARYFFLPYDAFEKYLRSEIELSGLKNLSQEWKYKFINFSSSDTCPAWEVVLSAIEDENWISKNLNRFVDNICIFFAYTNLHNDDKNYLFYLRETLSASPEKLAKFLSSLKNPAQKRAVYHAFLFTLNPIEYAIEKGLLQANATFWFKEPDRHIHYPEFAFRSISLDNKK